LSQRHLTRLRSEGKGPCPASLLVGDILDICEEKMKKAFGFGALLFPLPGDAINGVAII
jgi:hypothetical protein